MRAARVVCSSDYDRVVGTLVCRLGVASVFWGITTYSIKTAAERDSRDTRDGSNTRGGSHNNGRDDFINNMHLACSISTLLIIFVDLVHLLVRRITW